jgi:hypothetical protein
MSVRRYNDATRMTMARLESLSLEAAEALRTTSHAARVRATALACEAAVKDAALSGESDIVEALTALRSGEPHAGGLRERVEALAGRFDDEYFALAESESAAQGEEALEAFSKARAVAALAFALKGNVKDLQEAVYEAALAVSDPQMVLRAAIGALRS